MLAESWNEKEGKAEWKIQSTPGPSGALASELNGVSCTSLICAATGSYATSEHSSTLAEATP
jgi:hypothetical protein